MLIPRACLSRACRNYLRASPGLSSQSFHSSIIPYNQALATVASQEDELLGKSNPLLTAQTHTGIGNIAHALHILRAIEHEYGPVESYLFPREPGSGDYAPAFFFNFRNIQSFYKLERPYTHFDVPAFPLQVEPNHRIGLSNIHHLLSPLTSAKLGDDPVKARFALRIEVSDRQHYIEARPAPEVFAAQKNQAVQQALESWQPAAPVFGHRGVTQPLAQREMVGEQISESVNTLPPLTEADTSLWAQDLTPVQLEPEPEPEPEVAPENLPPLRMRPRSYLSRPAVDDQSPAAHEGTAANLAMSTPEAPARSDQSPVSTSSLIPGSKRQRILEHAQAAATRLAADRRAAAAAANEKRKDAELRSKTTVRNSVLSIWRQVLGR